MEENGNIQEVIFRSPTFGVLSFDGVLERMMERARDAYAECNKWLKEQPSRPMTGRRHEGV